MCRALKALLEGADGMEAQPAPASFERVADLAGFSAR
jgi:hypothetical protein